MPVPLRDDLPARGAREVLPRERSPAPDPLEEELEPLRRRASRAGRPPSSSSRSFPGRRGGARRSETPNASRTARPRARSRPSARPSRPRRGRSARRRSPAYRGMGDRPLAVLGVPELGELPPGNDAPANRLVGSNRARAGDDELPDCLRRLGGSDPRDALAWRAARPAPSASVPAADRNAARTFCASAAARKSRTFSRKVISSSAREAFSLEPRARRSRRASPAGRSPRASSGPRRSPSPCRTRP